jgi:hypothetical protein
MGDPVAADENASAPSCFMSRRHNFETKERAKERALRL